MLATCIRDISQHFCLCVAQVGQNQWKTKKPTKPNLGTIVISSMYTVVKKKNDIGLNKGFSQILFQTMLAT